MVEPPTMSSRSELQYAFLNKDSKKCHESMSDFQRDF